MKTDKSSATTVMEMVKRLVQVVVVVAVLIVKHMNVIMELSIVNTVKKVIKSVVSVKDNMNKVHAHNGFTKKFGESLLIVPCCKL